MRGKEIMMEVKIKKGITTDYKLAQALKITTARASDYMKGKRAPNVYTLTQAALILGVDPMRLIAEVEAETEKNEKKRKFWQDFLSHAERTAKFVMLVLIFMFSSLAGDSGKIKAASYNVYYVK